MDLTFSFIAEAEFVNSFIAWVSELFPTQGKTFPGSHVISRSPLGLLWLRFHSGRRASSLSLTWDCSSFPHGSVCLEPSNPQSTWAAYALFAFIAKQNHSFGVSTPIVPTPHSLVPICGTGLLPCSQLDKRPLAKICSSLLLRLSTMLLLPCLCHCAWASFSWLTLSAASLALPPSTTPTTHLLHDLLRQQRDAPTDVRDRWKVSRPSALPAWLLLFLSSTCHALTAVAPSPT